MSEERTFYASDPSGSGHDSEREAAVAAAQRILRVTPPAERERALRAVLAQAYDALGDGLRALQMLETELGRSLAREQMLVQAVAVASANAKDKDSATNNAKANDKELLMSQIHYYMTVGDHNIPLVAPAIGVAFLTADGTPYRQDPDSGLIHVAERHVAELVGLGFSAAGPADSPGRQ